MEGSLDSTHLSLGDNFSQFRTPQRGRNDKKGMRKDDNQNHGINMNYREAPASPPGGVDDCFDSPHKERPDSPGSPGGNKYNEDRIQNDLLDEICSDIGIKDAMELDLYDFDIPGDSAADFPTLPDEDGQGFDQTISYSQIQTPNPLDDPDMVQRQKGNVKDGQQFRHIQPQRCLSYESNQSTHSLVAPQAVIPGATGGYRNYQGVSSGVQLPPRNTAHMYVQGNQRHLNASSVSPALSLNTRPGSAGSSASHTLHPPSVGSVHSQGSHDSPVGSPATSSSYHSIQRVPSNQSMAASRGSVDSIDSLASGNHGNQKYQGYQPAPVQRKGSVDSMLNAPSPLPNLGSPAGSYHSNQNMRLGSVSSGGGSCPGSPAPHRTVYDTPTKNRPISGLSREHGTPQKRPPSRQGEAGNQLGPSQNMTDQDALKKLENFCTDTSQKIKTEDGIAKYEKIIPPQSPSQSTGEFKIPNMPSSQVSQGPRSNTSADNYADVKPLHSNYKQGQVFKHPQDPLAANRRHTDDSKAVRRSMSSPYEEGYFSVGTNSVKTGSLAGTGSHYGSQSSLNTDVSSEITAQDKMSKFLQESNTDSEKQETQDALNAGNLLVQQVRQQYEPENYRKAMENFTQKMQHGYHYGKPNIKDGKVQIPQFAQEGVQFQGQRPPQPHTVAQQQYGMNQNQGIYPPQNQRQPLPQPSPNQGGAYPQNQYPHQPHGMRQGQKILPGPVQMQNRQDYAPYPKVSGDMMQQQLGNSRHCASIDPYDGVMSMTQQGDRSMSQIGPDRIPEENEAFNQSSRPPVAQARMTHVNFSQGQRRGDVTSSQYNNQSGTMNYLAPGQEGLPESACSSGPTSPNRKKQCFSYSQPTSPSKQNQRPSQMYPRQPMGYQGNNQQYVKDNMISQPSPNYMQGPGSLDANSAANNQPYMNPQSNYSVNQSMASPHMGPNQSIPPAPQRPVQNPSQLVSNQYRSYGSGMGPQSSSQPMAGQQHMGHMTAAQPMGSGPMPGSNYGAMQQGQQQPSQPQQHGMQQQPSNIHSMSQNMQQQHFHQQPSQQHQPDLNNSMQYSQHHQQQQQQLHPGQQPLQPGMGMPSQDQSQHSFVQGLVTNGSHAFRTHQFFPLLRDLIIADMNFHSPTFPFALIANLPMDFDKLLQNFLQRNPPKQQQRVNPSVDNVIMDALKYAHTAIIEKILERKQKEGIEVNKPNNAIEDFCERFDRAVRNSMGGKGPEMPPRHQVGPPGHVRPITPQFQQQQFMSPKTFQSVSMYGSQSAPTTPVKPMWPATRTEFSDITTNSSSNKSNEPAEKPPSKKQVLPKEAVAIMMDWLREHQDNPYPNDDEKEMLIHQTKLTINQINYWFTNARRRILPKWALQRYMKEQQDQKEQNSGIQPIVA